jgi:hypothetical protein
LAWLGLACPFWLFILSHPNSHYIPREDILCLGGRERKGPHNEPAPTSTPWRMDEW